MSLLKISSKNLAMLAMPDYCPRCAWLKMRMEFKTPFAIFPGIFSSIDSYSKKITAHHHTRKQVIPSWFNDWCQGGVPIKVPHHTKFFKLDAATGITLSGGPDEIFQLKKGIFIWDYKTSRYTENAETLAPLYRAQLNGYADIAEALGMGSVVGLGLVYYEPMTDIVPEVIDEVLLTQGFNMQFRAKLVPVSRDTGLVPSLLCSAKKLMETPFAKLERAADCKDCKLVDSLVAACV